SLPVRRRSEPACDAAAGDPDGVVAAPPSRDRHRGAGGVGDHTTGNAPHASSEPWSACAPPDRHRLVEGVRVGYTPRPSNAPTIVTVGRPSSNGPPSFSPEGSVR